MIRTLVSALILAVASAGCDGDRNTFRVVGADDTQTAVMQVAVAEWCDVGKCITIGDGASSVEFVDDQIACAGIESVNGCATVKVGGAGPTD